MAVKAAPSGGSASGEPSVDVGPAASGSAKDKGAAAAGPGVAGESSASEPLQDGAGPNGVTADGPGDVSEAAAPAGDEEPAAPVGASVAGREGAGGAELSFQEEWTPPATELQSKPDDAAADAGEPPLEEGEQRCRACHLGTPSGEAACRHCFLTLQHAEDVGYDAQIAAKTLRAALCESFRKRRVVRGGAEIKAALLAGTGSEGGADGADGAGEEAELEGPALVAALEALELHVPKRVARALLADRALAPRGAVRVQALAALLNEAAWWPSGEEIAQEAREVTRLQGRVAALLGAEAGAAIAGESNAALLRAMLAQAEKDQEALQEVQELVAGLARSMGGAGGDAAGEATLHAYTAPAVTVLKSPARGAGAGGPRSQSAMEMRDLDPPSPSGDDAPGGAGVEGSERRHRDFGGGLKAINERAGRHREAHRRRGRSERAGGGSHSPPATLRSLEVPRAVQRQLVARVGQRAPVAQLGRFAAAGTNEWRTWVNPKTNKVHAPLRRPRVDIVGSARLRSREYTAALADNSRRARRARVEEHRGCWSVEKTAKRYTRWERLDQPIPGFSAPGQVPRVRHSAPWTPLSASQPYKLGSRYAEPVSGAVERLTASAMLNDSLRDDRGRKKAVLAGQDHLVHVRRCVAAGRFDEAVSHAERARTLLAGAGAAGADLLREVEREAGGAGAYVERAVRGHASKLLAHARDHLVRLGFDRAAALVPPLREAAAWLGTRGVVHPPPPEPTFYEKRRGLVAADRPAGTRLVQQLQSEIEEKEGALAAGMEAHSLASFFASAAPLLDLDSPAHRALVEEADARPNCLPEEMVMDGRTYVVVVDLPAGARAPPGAAVEQVTLSAPGVVVKSLTVPHPGGAAGRAVVALVPAPADPVGAAPEPGAAPRAAPLFGEVQFSAVGASGGAALLGGATAPGCRTRLLPPPGLRLPARYAVWDALSGAALPDAVVEFTQVSSLTGEAPPGGAARVAFKAGEAVALPGDGVYLASVRARRDGGYPWTPQHAPVVALAGCTGAEAHVHLPRAVTRPDELRVVVSWAGGTVRELDTHVYSSAMDAVDFARGGEGNGASGITLNLDSCSGRGPETATLRVRPKLGYALSLRLAGAPDDTPAGAAWLSSMARARVYDASGLVAVLHLPPVDPTATAAELRWWHLLALHGADWRAEGHGLLRVNQLAPDALPQLAVPGWTLLDAAARADWEELLEELARLGAPPPPGAVMPVPAMPPRQLSTLTNMRGESLLGLACRVGHDSEDGADAAAGDEHAQTPAEKQLRAVRGVLAWTLALDKRASSVNAQAQGLPSEATLLREVRERGAAESYVFRAAVHASQAVAVEVFGLLAQVTRRSTLSSVIRTFFYTHGMDLLLACVARRPPGSVAPVLEAVLGVEAIWERQQRRFFDVGDRVQLERPQGSGTWLPGAVAKAGLDRTQVLLDPPPPSAEEAARDAACGDGHGACGALHPSLRNQETVEVHPLRLRWRCAALPAARARHQDVLAATKAMELKETITPEQRRLLKAEVALKRCITLLSDKFSD